MYSCVRFYEFDKYLSSNVPQELCNDKTHGHMIDWIRRTFSFCGAELRSPLTLYVLSNEGVIHYVTVISFQYFLKFCNVIVLVSTGRKK